MEVFDFMVRQEVFSVLIENLIYIEFVLLTQHRFSDPYEWSHAFVPEEMRDILVKVFFFEFALQYVGKYDDFLFTMMMLVHEI